MQLKAYVIPAEFDAEGMAEILFESTRGRAQARAANNAGIPFVEARKEMRRAKEFDEYAPGPVPVDVLLQKHDWRFECSGCMRMVSLIDLEHGGAATASDAWCPSCEPMKAAALDPAAAGGGDGQTQ